MNEQEAGMPRVEAQPERTHGFAPGDRVAITRGDYKGAYGKVIHVRKGCAFYSPGGGCIRHCFLVTVDLMAKPNDVTDDYVRDPAAYRQWLGLGRDVDLTNARRFIVGEVTHVD